MSRNVAALPTEVGGVRAVELERGSLVTCSAKQRFVSPWVGWGLPMVPAL